MQSIDDFVIFGVHLSTIVYKRTGTLIRMLCNSLEQMKKRFVIISLVMLGLLAIVYKLNSEVEGVANTFSQMHSLENSEFTLIKEKISPNGNFKYLQYQFDNGGFGYSRVFWSVIENNSSEIDLKKGLIPDGFKIYDWNENNHLILEKWTPYYDIKKEDLNSGMKINGVMIAIKEN